jgi:hypothetical protein
MKLTKDEVFIDKEKAIKHIKPTLTNAKKIDAKKLKTLEDVILIIECIGVVVEPWSENYQRLEHLLEDEQ